MTCGRSTMTTSRVVTSLVIFALSSIAFCVELIPCTNGEDGWYLFNGYCYNFIEDNTRRNWDQARAYCKNNLKGDIISITSQEENAYVAGVLKDHDFIKSPSSYIGLRAVGINASYKWADGKVFDFNNWIDGKVILPQTRTSCGVITSNQGTWGAVECNILLKSFICKKEKSTIAPVTQPPFGTGNCDDNTYRNFRGKCYKFYSDRIEDGGGSTYDEAKRTCQKNGGDLASIHSQDEQDVMTVELASLNTTVWIGLRKDTQWGAKHEWGDKSEFDFANWAPGEPSSSWGFQEPCVEMLHILNVAGKWNDAPCDKKLGFVCQNKADPKKPKPPAPNNRCRTGQTRLRDACFKVETIALDWQAAETKCKAYPNYGHLASVNDNFDQALINVLSKETIQVDMWLGFSDRNQSNNGLFSWVDGYPVYFTKWDTNQPQADTVGERCVSMKPNERWTVKSCDTKLPYVCRSNDKTPPVKPVIFGSCPQSNTTQWVDVGSNYCYTVNYRNPKTWDESLRACAGLGQGVKLASFHSQHDLDLMRTSIADTENNLWIGLIQDDNGEYKWYDGTPADFIPWDDGEPTLSSNEGCVEILARKLKYNNLNCQQRRGYICEVLKIPFPTTTPGPTTLPPRTDCGPAFRNWKYFNGNCYLPPSFQPGKKTWYDGVDYCNNNGGHLVSVHSVEENNFLFTMVPSGTTSTTYWIGLSATNGESFEWSDDTLLNFNALQDTTENLLTKDEKCVSVNSYRNTNKTWALQRCSLPHFIMCKREFGITPSTITPTPSTKAPGVCPDGWVRTGNKCLKLFGTTDGEKANYTMASAKCKAAGTKGVVLSIRNDIEQEVVNTLLPGVTGNVLIGLRRIQNYYEWNDHTPFKYQNWATGQPTNIYRFICTTMQTIRNQPGKWLTSDCAEKTAYICQIAPSTEVVTTVPTPTECWTKEEGYVKFGNSCFKMYTGEPKTWDDAEEDCKRRKGHLASINNGFEQSFLNTRLSELTGSGQSDSLWIGLSAEPDSKQFKWADKWPVYYTNWGSLQPQGFNGAKRCVFLDVNRKEWNSTECSKERSYICEISKDEPPVIPEVPKGVCPDHVSDWYDIGTEHCYHVENGASFTKLATWADANTFCLKYNAELASIHSKHELDMLGTYLKQSSNQIWIGLLMKHHGEFEWHDKTPLDFVQWEDGEPKNISTYQCGSLNPNSLQWKVSICTQRLGFICKIRKDTLPTTTPVATTVLPTTTVIPTTVPPRTNCGLEFKNWKYFNGNCYLEPSWQIGMKNWYDAVEYCNSNGGHLISIHSAEENNFLFEMLLPKSTFTTCWVGLSATNGESFEWSDDTLLNFNALQGTTENLLTKDEKCVSVNSYRNPNKTWDLQRCSQEQGVICKREFGITPSTITPTPSTKAPGVCPDGWVRTGNKCLKLFGTTENEKANYTIASTKCKTAGNKGNLVSITNDAEQEVVNTLLPGVAGNVLIGLKRILNYYEWADHTPFTYQNWAPGQPNTITVFACAMILTTKNQPGKWLSSDCTDKIAYICQSAPSTSVVTTVPTPPDCGTNEEGYVKFGNSCFKIYTGEPKTWDDAEEDCESRKGHLASINSGFEQSFFNTRLSGLTGLSDSLWIGLSAQADTKQFKWTDKWPVYYTNWGSLQPQSFNGAKRCVFLNVNRKEWNSTECSEERSYICEISKDEPPVIPEVPKGVCPDHVNEWVDIGFEHCYHVENGASFTKTAPWADANTFCLKYNAELASFHSQHELDMLAPYLKQSSNPIWIGLLMKHHGEFEWHDETPLDFVQWENGEPKNVSTYQCGMINPITLQWKVNYCAKPLGFICKIKKVMINIPTTKPVTQEATLPVTTPGPTTAPRRTHCGPEFPSWRYFDGSCYLQLNANSRKTWYEGVDYCNHNGGHSASIHSVEENNFLFEMIQEQYTTYWIGLSATNDESFEWSDDTILNFNALQDTTENLLTKDEKCVSVTNYQNTNNKWSLQQCNARQGVICKRPFGVTPSTITPTPSTKAPGVCPDGWVRTGNKCLKIFGTTENEKANYTMASTKCNAAGNKGNLLSIPNNFEQEVANTLLLGVPGNVWIGLRKISYAYEWVDHSPFNYENWAAGESRSFFENMYTMMQTTRNNPGKWKSSNGTEKIAYICQIAPSTNVVTTVPTPPECWTNEDGYVKFGNSCFKMYKDEPKTWNDAEEDCKNRKGHLASINSGFEQSFVNTRLSELTGQSDSLWIGLNAEPDTKRFKWADKWPVYYTKWGSLQPQAFNSTRRCVFLDVNRKEWNSTDCSEERSYICEISKDEPPAIPEVLNAVCPDHVSKWIDIGTEHCYYLQSGLGFRESVVWADAIAFCVKFDAELASIHSQHETDLLAPYFKDFTMPIWIGLVKKHHGEFEWFDKTPLDFAQWDDGEPNNNTYQCGMLNPISLKWRTNYCSKPLGFICRIKKVMTNTPSPPPEKKSESRGLGGGAVAGIVISVILAVLAISGVVYFYLKRRNTLPSSSPGVSFRNNLYEGSN